MLDKLFRKGPVQTDRSRAVFILIALAGVLPSALVLWFTSLAIRNEQLATAKFEEEAHQVLLNQIKSDLIQDWNALLEKADQRVASMPPAAAFYDAITQDGFDGLIILTAADTNRVAYPGLPKRAVENNSPAMLLAVGGVLGASESRLPARSDTQDINTHLDSQLAVLAAAIQRRDGDKAERAALSILGNADFERCVDKNGRHTLSSIELYILENRDVVSQPTYALVLSRLTARINNYRLDLIPASQRRFLINRISALTSQTSLTASHFPTMSAEVLSARFMEANEEIYAGPYLNRSAIVGVWQQRLPSGHAIALFTELRLRKRYADWLAAMDNPFAARVRVDVGVDNNTHESAGSEMLLGAAFPGWRLRITGANADAYAASPAWIYVALSVASIFVILIILVVIASMTLRRLALAQQKNTMVATVSHELKTPVSSIRLLVDTLLQDRVFRPDRVREYLHLISRENLRLSQLIENFLSFSRIERTKFRIEKQPLDIAELIGESIATFSRQVEIVDGELAVEIASDVPAYRADAWALNRVMLNLLDNAHKFSDPPRRIGVAARVEKQSMTIAVSDNGIGIREADLEQIFSQFYQADQRLSRSNEGCGLGLSIVRHIVNLHGGTIAVNSRLGEGSTFTIHLPLE